MSMQRNVFLHSSIKIGLASYRFFDSIACHNVRQHLAGTVILPRECSIQDLTHNVRAESDHLSLPRRAELTERWRQKARCQHLSLLTQQGFLVLECKLLFISQACNGRCPKDLLCMLHSIHMMGFWEQDSMLWIMHDVVHPLTLL